MVSNDDDDDESLQVRVDGFNDKYKDILRQETIDEMLTPSAISVNHSVIQGFLGGKLLL